MPAAETEPPPGHKGSRPTPQRLCETHVRLLSGTYEVRRAPVLRSRVTGKRFGKDCANAAGSRAKISSLRPDTRRGASSGSRSSTTSRGRHHISGDQWRPQPDAARQDRLLFCPL